METMIDKINQRLLEIVSTYKDGKVKEAIAYSLLAGGKRIRPVLLLEVVRSYDVDYQKYLDIACALEMIHTYSLIHDDLPGMDNDDLRRGKPTCHKRFDEATAILAGDALLNEAMNVVLNADIESDLKLDALAILFGASGINGMIYGQELDIRFENKKANIEELKTIHTYKTGALISAALTLGAVFTNKKDMDTWSKIGYSIGLAFQIQDDILDVIGDTKVLGKTIGSDETNNKSTYVTLLGIDSSKEEVDRLFKEAIVSLYSLSINHGILLHSMQMLKKRVS